MKKTFLAFTIILVALQFAEAQQRYFDEVFTNVQITPNVKYGENISVLTGTPDTVDLRMDVYEPTGDTAQVRPLIIYLHTGSFLPLLINGTPTGDLRDSAVVEMCKQFARRGYTVVAADYRLGWNPIGATQDIRTGTLLTAVYRAIQDAKTCVRYIRMDVATQGNTYKVDVNKIVIGGQGSGGYVAFAYASLDDPAEIALLKFISATTDATYGFVAGQPYVNQALVGDFDGLGGIPQLNLPNWSGYSNSINMVFNMGGAMGDSSWLEAGDVPMVAFHVTNDPFAPYTNGPVIVPTTGQFVVWVTGSHDVIRLCNQNGNNDVFNIPYNDPYTTRANQINNGWEGLFPFILPDPGAPFNGQAGPWEWWSQAALEAVAPFYGLSAAQAATVSDNGLLTNPDMSKNKALGYIDSVQGYLAPRIVQQLQLPGYFTGIGDVNLFEGNVDLFPNPAMDQFTLQLDDAGRQIDFLQVFDAAGRMVKEIPTIHSNQITISKEALTPGMYLLKIGVGNETLTGKLLIQ